MTARTIAISVDRQPSMTAVAQPRADRGPLASDGWLEFNRITHRVEPLRFAATLPGVGSIAAVLYLDGRGRVRLPRLNPYLPVAWTSNAADVAFRRHRHWLALAQPLVAEMRARGLANSVRLSADVTDARPWQWAGFRVSPQYTFVAGLPLPMAAVDPAVRRKVRQAGERGYVCERLDRSEAELVVRCLAESEARQGFSYALSAADLLRLADHVGDDAARLYGCFGPRRELAAVRIVLHAPGHAALDWVSGTARAHLTSGATQLLIRAAIDDVTAAGATAFDFEGAGIPGVSAAKMTWGPELRTWYQVESFGARGLARWVRDALRYERGGVHGSRNENEAIEHRGKAE